VRPFLEYEAACWDPYSKEQINTSDRVQYNVAIIEHHRNDSNWGTLAQRGMIAGICALLKAYTIERVWKAIGDTSQRPCTLSRVDHVKKIMSRKQRTDIRKYSFVNTTTQLWKKLPADAVRALSCKPNNFKKRARKVIKMAK
jgi:hypothetical protein